jgi:alkylated DNA repair dioxygenase AlkB
MSMSMSESWFEYDSTLNLLPRDGSVFYYGSIFDHDLADAYFEDLMSSTNWSHDQVHIAGKLIQTARKVAWVGDSNYAYAYSGTTKHADPWSDVLLNIKFEVERRTRSKFNSCLLNLYHSGGEGMTWHSDNEKSLGINTTIASVSFGAERKFAFKHKQTGETVSLMLAHSSLLVMKDQTQHHWLHALMKSQLIKQPRINLTFRTIQT